MPDKNDQDRTVRLAENEALKELKAEQANIARILSHDLKSPIKSVRQVLDWIQGDLDNISDDTQQNFMVVQDRLIQIDKLLQDLVTYTRVEKQQTENQNTLVNIRRLIQEEFDTLEKSKNFTLAMDAPDVDIDTDAIHLRSVVRQLLENAIRHHNSESGSITVTVTEEDTSLFKFQISDDGPGIPDKHRELIFNMCQTLKPKSKDSGSGLGLPIAHKIVRAQGGSLWLEETKNTTHSAPRPPLGATFCFTWPK